MTFATRLGTLARRYLSRRSFELIVAPALADLEYEDAAGAGRRTVRQLAVARAFAGAVGDELARESGTFLVLTLVPTAYFAGLMAIFSGLSTVTAGMVTTTAAVAVLSLGFTIICFRPERDHEHPVD